MSKQTEALKLALSVLNEVRSETFRLMRNGQKLYAEEKVWNAIFVIKQALAEQPAQQQEPVAWMDGYRNIYSLEEKAAGCPEATIALVPMANHKKTSGSPINELQCVCGAVWLGDEMVHLPNKHQPASKPLTDEQIMEMYNEPRSDAEMIAFARAIEAAHGIGEQK